MVELVRWAPVDPRRGQRHAIESGLEDRLDVAVRAGAGDECTCAHAASRRRGVGAVGLAEAQGAEARAVALLGVAALEEDEMRPTLVVLVAMSLRRHRSCLPLLYPVQAGDNRLSVLRTIIGIVGNQLQHQVPERPPHRAVTLCWHPCRNLPCC